MINWILHSNTNKVTKNHILYTKASKILEPCKIIANETNEKITQYNFLTSI